MRFDGCFTARVLFKCVICDRGLFLLSSVSDERLFIVKKLHVLYLLIRWYAYRQAAEVVGERSRVNGVSCEIGPALPWLLDVQARSWNALTW